MRSSRTALTRSQPGPSTIESVLLHFLAAPRREDDLGIAPREPPGSTMRSLRESGLSRKLREDRSAAGDGRRAPRPSGCPRSAARPILRRTLAGADGKRRRRRRGCDRGPRFQSIARARSASAGSRPAPPSIRIIWRISRDAALVERHDVRCRGGPARAPRSACRSENASTRSGFSASILSNFALMNADDLRLLPRLGRADGVARDADDAIALAQQVERLGRLLGQADDAARILVSIHLIGSWFI